MPDNELFPIPRQMAQSAWVNETQYFKMYEDSIKHPDKFWGEAAKRVDWIKPYTKVKNASFTGNVSIKWYEDGTLNASSNCIDRHLATCAPTRPRSCGKATIRRKAATSATASCMKASRSSPTS